MEDSDMDDNRRSLKAIQVQEFRSKSSTWLKAMTIAVDHKRLCNVVTDIQKDNWAELLII